MNSTANRADHVEAIDHLMYEIVWHAQKQITHTLTQPAIDLTLPQLTTLLAVQQSSSCRMSVLAELTRQSAGTLTGIVDRLIDDQLLERTRSVNDRRVIDITLTAEGKRRLSDALVARQSEMQHALAQFSNGELHDFAYLLDRFLSSLHHEVPVVVET